MRKEVWREIAGYEGLYWVSSLGRVKSKKKILSLSLTEKGYYRTSLSRNSLSRGFSVHRLVGKAFIPNPKNKKTINHKNGIKTDNKVENLEWATYKENNVHAYQTGLATDKIGTKNYNARLTLEDVVYIRNSTQKNNYIAKQFGISRSHVGNIKTKVRWKTLE